MRTAQRFVKNLFSLSVAHIAAQIIGFFVVILIARKLGAVAFGQLSFAKAFVSYFLLASNFGFTIYAIKEVAREKKSTCQYAGNIVALRLLLSSISFLIFWVLLFLIDFTVDKRLILLYFGLTLFPLAFDLTWVFSAHERMEFRAVILIFKEGIYALLIFALLFRFPSAITVAKLKLLAIILASLLSIGLYLCLFGRLRLKYDRRFLLDFLHGALPIGFSLLMIRVYYNLDTVMLSFMKGDAVVGSYNAAYRIIIALISFGGLYGSVFLPTLSSQIKESNKNTRSMIEKSLKLLVIIAIPLGIGGTILAFPIINLFFGKEYINAVVPFQILLWACVIIYISEVSTNALIAFNKQRQLMFFVIFGAVSNILLNFLVIPHFGSRGAAVTTCISEGIVFTGGYLTIKKIVPISIVPYLIKPIFSSIIMGTILYLLKGLNVFSLIIMGIMIYVLVLYLIKGISSDDIHLIKKIFVRH